MAMAAVLSVEETRQAVAKTRARQQLHAQLARGLDELEAHMPEDSPSLEELTQAVCAMRQELTGKITEALVEQLHGRLLQQRTMCCPDGHRLLRARPAPPRTVHTMVGEVSLSRSSFYCPSCQQGFAPLDDALQLSERRTPWDLQQAAARLAAEVPFATAQELFTPLTGLWKEAKGFRFYLVDQERSVHLLSWSQVGSDEDLGAALKHVPGAGLIPEDQVRLGVIGDGAKWIWNQVSALLPTAVQILDDYPCREHVHQVGALQFNADAVQEREWVEAMMARLFWGYVDWAIEGLEALQPRDAHTAEEIRKLIGFLQTNAGRLHDRTARKGGYPLGSGGIEAANKRISHGRLKRSGAWWYLERANRMLALRGAIYNGTFERVFAAYKRRALQRHGGEPSVRIT